MADTDKEEEQKAARQLARGADSKTSHRYLALRVYWTQGTERNRQCYVANTEIKFTNSSQN